MLFMEGKADPIAQPQLAKPAMWGGDTLVHQGYISRYWRNGYSADYDDLWNYIYAAVTCYSSGPDTCYLYASLTGASSWFANGPGYFVSEYGSDLCNPQVVKGEGSHPQEYYLPGMTPVIKTTVCTWPEPRTWERWCTHIPPTMARIGREKIRWMGICRI